MVSLFSVFDPSSFLGVNINWVVLLLVMFFPVCFFLVFGKLLVMYFFVVDGLMKFFKEMVKPNYFGTIYLGVGAFLMLLYFNLGGLFPFVFSSTSHPVITLSLGLIMWMSFFLMGYLANLFSSVSHLVPEGSPIYLAPFLVLIESVSHLIRPMTLSIRLAANMMAGHLIVGLLSSVSLMSIGLSMFSFFSQVILMILELCVCVIQAIVFSILLMLYMLEYY